MKGMLSWLMLGLAAMLSSGPSPQDVLTSGSQPLQPRRVGQTVTGPAGAISRPPAILTMTGAASWYSTTDPGIQPQTASGEPFDDTQLTCATWNLPFHTRLHVTNLETGREVVVRVNDRGPARRLVAEGRVIDLSKAAFRQIAGLERGLIPVRVELLASD